MKKTSYTLSSLNLNTDFSALTIMDKFHVKTRVNKYPLTK